MNITLENARFRAIIDTHGAEINSLQEIADGTEFIWNGDPSVWKYHAPILFPHVGRIRDGFMTYGGKEYKLAINGFARDMDFTLIKNTSDSAEFELTENDYTADKYPWKFSLKVNYKLTENDMIFTSTVTNTDKEKISFSLGSHSALCCPRNTDKEGTKNSDYVIEFEKKEALTSVVCTDDGYLASDENGIAPYTKPYGEKDAGIIPMTEKGFGNGHFFTAFSSDWVGLRNKATGKLVRINTKDYPYVMIWQNAGEPRFVCIEPWYGVPDPAVTSHAWEIKPGLVFLEPGKSFTSDQTISIL
ncbi:aldose 1-epimerase family protein [Treponema parvum]|uniref:Aldose 1-epimerase family protein n=1 Tax=Treponema parvum TaxID=138851 RepID=A0A975F356_9SPIR|nr:aldose 1-epimerase family protein [Treponema parvum]QTQ13450.1 aldose 1-epimerase family protein [Treponema parvum]